jgi:hypothetical protein
MHPCLPAALPGPAAGHTAPHRSMWKPSRWMTPGEAGTGTCVRLTPRIGERVLGAWP